MLILSFLVQWLVTLTLVHKCLCGAMVARRPPKGRGTGEGCGVSLDVYCTVREDLTVAYLDFG